MWLMRGRRQTATTTNSDAERQGEAQVARCQGQQVWMGDAAGTGADGAAQGWCKVGGGVGELCFYQSPLTEEANDKEENLIISRI